MAASLHHAPSPHADLKRKRSPSHETAHPPSAPLPKAAKTNNHLQINYLARQLDHDLPLITNDDTLPNILSLLTEYQGVLDRHESMACNLGARPLGPILIKRFERLFDGPPRVLKSHGKDRTTVTWLDVFEFARNKPEQFQLGQMSEGVRVCQFYTKQCRVQISEEDFVLISSGIPQKMIPPQPIIEDEEKELGTIEILEKNLAQICQLADQVAARTRQLNHRLKGRKQAILDRRSSAAPAPPIRPSSPSNVALMNGGSSALPNHPPTMPQTSPSGFVAVNSRPQHEPHGNGASSSTRHELMSKFHTVHERHPSNGASDTRPSSVSGQGVAQALATVTHAAISPPNSVDSHSTHTPRAGLANEPDLHSMVIPSVPIQNTSSNLLLATSQRSAQPQEKDDGGPFKAEMVQRMESLAKGERILPPCDRCRRLHMDCLKNLTACMGCTKKHAKCSWKEVREVELRGNYNHPTGSNSNVHSESSDQDSGDRASTASPGPMLSPTRHGMTPSHVSSSNGGGQTPQSAQHHAPHAQTEHSQPEHARPALQSVNRSQPHSQYELQLEARVPQSHASPSAIEPNHDGDKGVEAQLQEAAKSSLAHANVSLRIGNSDAKNADFHPTMVA